MKAVTFKLSGRTAFFKKPDVNVATYFTYNNVHKIALLGILGSVIGLEGYIQQFRDIKEKGDNEENKYPEFYDKLKNLKIAIEPKGNYGYFTKKIHKFNNTVGYASKEKGGNLIIREQWLENPSWQIYILNDDCVYSKIYNKLEDYLLNKKCIFMPYLGKNDHPALIDNVKVINIEPVEKIGYINTLFKEEQADVGEVPYDFDRTPYFFREISPVGLNEEHNFYEFEKLCFTNLEIKDNLGLKDIYCYNEKILSFI